MPHHVIANNNHTLQPNDIEPRIYVACLAAYNNGYLYGRWIDATQDEDAIYEDINDMLTKSPIPHAEDWAIHATSGFASLDISEHASIAHVCKAVQFIQEYGELGALAVDYYGDFDSARNALNDHYQGEWDREIDFTTELFDNCYGDSLPEHLQFYVDYEKFNRDLFINDYFALENNGKMHVFSHH